MTTLTNSSVPPFHSPRFSNVPVSKTPLQKQKTEGTNLYLTVPKQRGENQHDSTWAVLSLSLSLLLLLLLLLPRNRIFIHLRLYLVAIFMRGRYRAVVKGGGCTRLEVSAVENFQLCIPRLPRLSLLHLILPMPLPLRLSTSVSCSPSRARVCLLLSIFPFSFS